jgi:hypothetical protein
MCKVLACNGHAMDVITCNSILGVSLMIMIPMLLPVPAEAGQTWSQCQVPNSLLELELQLELQVT